MFDPDFTTSSSRTRQNYNDINLSTSQATSSSALLSNIRAERAAREENRRKEIAALLIQRVWRGRKISHDTKGELIAALRADEDIGLERMGRGLVVLLRDGWGGLTVSQRAEVEKVLVRWCDLAVINQNGILGVAEPLQRDQDWAVILGLHSVRMVELVLLNPTSSSTPVVLSTLEAIFNPSSYAGLPPNVQAYTRETLVHIVSERGWVEKLVAGLEKLVSLSVPKQKHPSLTPVARLLTAPFSLVPSTPESLLIPPLINHLLAVPSLPASLPLPALTHLSSHLSLFPLLLLYASSNPAVLTAGKMETELGRTYFLANLATFGITGQMLARAGVAGASTWMGVVGFVLNSVDEGWGRWVDGIIDDDDDDVVPIRPADSDDDADPDDAEVKVGDSTLVAIPTPAKQTKRPRRAPLPPAIRSKLHLFASPVHISTLASHLSSYSSKAPRSLMTDFAVFCVGLLTAFKGSPKYEGVLDALSEGDKGRGLVKRIWREGVRGRWSDSADSASWDTFGDNPATPSLLLLTYIYNHYLLLTPDDEFFSPASNPLTTDEILELAGIWRDLAFWGYINGVNSASSTSASDVRDIGAGAGKASAGRLGSEEVRGLFTRGVTRVVERSARRKFADPDFWVMRSQMDMRGFVEAASHFGRFEDAELTSSGDADVEMSESATLPRWARARQRFTKRQMAYISPRLGLLNNLPMSVPFQTRLEVFRKFIETDQQRLGIAWHNRRRYRTKAKIRRNRLAEDGFDELSGVGPALKGRIEITFYDQYGLEEAGIDGGGLFKEFLTSLSKDVFDTNRGLWLMTDQNELYPNPHSYATEPHQLSWYRFIGQVLGKAIYDGILVDVSFANFFLAKWLGRQSYLDDLNSMDKDLSKGLTILKNYPKPEELALNFAITEDDFGEKKTIELVPGGAEIGVTAENRHEYIQLVCRYKLDKQIAAQSRAFFNGLSDLIDAKWLRMFDQQELQQLIGGEEAPIDIDDLRAHCSIDGFPDDTTPRLFWHVVKGFSQEQKKALLRFVTSCSRPPLLGFGNLYPKFGVKFSGADTERLPSASACFNLLKLPGYRTEHALRTKLLQAIESGVGFDLS
ncbi:ubiquitin-protein ligase E3 C [Kwoniella heveanensis BCC8398]|uniref:HECT-type E3 ubiquitin transferase n=1 Tax=Kwoniella heveanensis BCC8398 TaxID=1296120 RepID=A0A1B9GNH3_9TREE|nr:ubiquitin-protein ligase E3 C [Kwoniella heveanensis BCC8398]